nr:nucleoside diphosphate kinase [Hymenolepis microstoma]
MRRDAHSVMKDMLYGCNSDKINIFANPDIFMPTQDPKSSDKFSRSIFSIPANSLSKKHFEIKDSTCAVIKPHAVNNGLIGEIWENILSGGFQIIAVRDFILSKADAIEFLEVYKGVLNEYPKLINEFTNGICVALHITHCDPRHTPGDPDSVQQKFREFIGPMDPEIARCIKPNSIRAKYGVNLVENAVHCTDLPDDVQLEIDFLFRMLSD